MPQRGRPRHPHPQAHLNPSHGAFGMPHVSGGEHTSTNCSLHRTTQSFLPPGPAFCPPNTLRFLSSGRVVHFLVTSSARSVDLRTAEACGGTAVPPHDRPLPHEGRCLDGVVAARRTRQPGSVGSIPALGSAKRTVNLVLVPVLTRTDDAGTHLVVTAGGTHRRPCCVPVHFLVTSPAGVQPRYHFRDERGGAAALPRLPSPAQSTTSGSSHHTVSENFSPLTSCRVACGCVTRLGHTIRAPTSTSAFVQFCRGNSSSAPS